MRSSDDGHFIVDGATTEVEATVVTEGHLEGELALNSGITTNNLVLVVELSLWDRHSISSLGGGCNTQKGNCKPEHLEQMGVNWKDCNEYLFSFYTIFLL